MGIVFVFGLVGFLTGLASIVNGNTFLGTIGVAMGTSAMILSLASLVWPPRR